MSLALFVYLASVIPNIGALASILAVVTTFACGLYAVHCATDYKEPEFKWKFVAIPAILIAISVVTPSEKTMYLMAGAYTAEQVVQSEVGQDVVKIINLKVKDYLNELEVKGTKK